MVLVVVGCLFYPIKIGVVIPADSISGMEEILAVKFWVSKHPKIGFKRVKLYVESPRRDPCEIREAYMKLVEQGVCTVIGGALSAEGVVLADLAAKTGVPTFGITTTTTLISDRKDNYYRFIDTNDVLACYAARYTSEQGFERALIIESSYNTEYTKGYVNAFTESFKGKVETLVLSDVPNTIIAAMESLDPDVIVLVLSPSELLMAVKTIRSYDEAIPLISSPWGYEQATGYYWNPLLNGLVVVSMFTPRIRKFEELVEEFKKATGAGISTAVLYSFMIMENLYKAIERAGGKREKIIRYFDTPRIYEGAFGRIYMNDCGDAASEYVYISRMMNRHVETIGMYRNKFFPTGGVNQ